VVTQPGRLEALPARERHEDTALLRAAFQRFDATLDLHAPVGAVRFHACVFELSVLRPNRDAKEQRQDGQHELGPPAPHELESFVVHQLEEPAHAPS